LLIVGGIFVTKFGSVQVFSVDKLVPDITDLSLLPYFAIVAFCFGGLELAPVLAGEIQDPERNIPRAIVITSVIIGLLYILGTLMLIFTIPEGQVGIREGVAQAFSHVGIALEIPAIGTLGAILVAFGTLGLFGAWMTGTARVPFVVGLDQYLPDAFGKIHPRWGSPYVALLVQGGILTCLFLFSILGTTVKEAFLILLDMSIILYFIPFMYMFASLVWHLQKNTGGRGIIPFFQQSKFQQGKFQKSKLAIWLVTILGFGTTLFSAIISAVPTRDIEHKELFVIKVVGGATALIAIGLVVYYLERRKKVLKAQQHLVRQTG
jgi:amino acid transporter